MNEFSDWTRQKFGAAKTKAEEIKTDISNLSMGNADLAGLTGPAADPKYHAKKIIKLLGQTKVQETISIVGAIESVSGKFDVNLSDLHGLIDSTIDGIKDGTKGAVKRSGHLQSAKTKLTEMTKPIRDLWAAIKQWMKEAMETITTFFKEAWSKVRNDWVIMAIKEAEQILSFIAASVVDIVATSVSAAAPAVGYAADGLGIATGLFSAGRNSWHFGKMEYHRKHFSVFNGAPDMIVKSLERHYVTRIASSATSTLQSSATLAMRASADGGGFGAGAIVGLVLACLDAVFHFIDRMAERIMLRVALWQAKEAHLTDYKELSSNYEAFCSWFRTWLMFCPVLGSVVLRAVYGKHPERFVMAVTTSTSSEKQVGRLAKHAARYLNQHKDEYGLKFASEAEAVKLKLKAAYG